MKLVTFTHDGKTRTGAVEGEEVVDLAAAGVPASMLALIEGGEEALATARDAVSTAPRFSLTEVRLEAPISRPPKILAIGLNYRSHARECGLEPPALPVIFNKQATAANGPYDDVYLPPESEQIDYEGELGIVIGTRCRRVSCEDAPSVILGFTVANDTTVRDWQRRVPTMTMGKSWDTHCPFGPCIVTADAIADPHRLKLRTLVNGEVRQEAETSDLIFDCYDVIEHLSTAFTLEAGDLILTGTPSGVAAFREGQPWLRAGDVVEVEIEGLGRIRNRMVTEPANS